MGLIKKPSEITPKTTATILVYGQPGMGKTTLACSSDAPVLFDFDGGVDRIKAEHMCDTLQVTQWEEVSQALQEVKAAGCYKTLVIDTIGKMLDCIIEHIKRTQPNMVQRDGTLSLKGYGVRKNIWKQFLQDISQMGMSVYFVGHEKEEKQGDLTVKRADAGNATTANDLFKDLDLIGYLSANGKKRTLDFEGSDIIYAKAPQTMRKAYQVDVVVDAQGNASRNDYFKRVVMADLNAYRNANQGVRDAYHDLILALQAMADGVTNAQEADAFAAYVKGCKHVLDSVAVARKMLGDKVAALGLTFDRKTGKFADPQPAAPAKSKKAKAAAEAEVEPNAE